MSVLEVYRRRRRVLRRRRQWGWRLKVNGRVVVGDQGQGYENRPKAEEMARAVIGGAHAHAKTV